MNVNAGIMETWLSPQEATVQLGRKQSDNLLNVTRHWQSAKGAWWRKKALEAQLSNLEGSTERTNKLGLQWKEAGGDKEFTKGNTMLWEEDYKQFFKKS